MSSSKTDTDSSVIFIGEQHLVQLHPDQEERMQNPANFVQNTQTSRESGQTSEASDIDVTTVQETQIVTSIPETQNTGKILQKHLNNSIQCKNLQKLQFSTKIA